MNSVRRFERGHTLIELMIVGGLMLVLTIAACQIWQMGASALLKVDRKTKLAGDLQVVTMMLREQIGDASKESFSFVDTASVSGLSFLSPRELRSSGERVHLPSGQLRLNWRKYEIFYLKKSSGELFFRELSLPVGSAQVIAPTPIEKFDSGSGPRGLETYCVDGRRLCEGVDTLEGRWDEGALVVKLSGLGSDPRALKEERLGWEVVIWPRN